MNRFFQVRFFQVTLAAVLFSYLGIASAEDAAMQELDVAAQPLSTSLRQVAEEFDLKIAFYSDSTDGVEAPALAGAYTPNEALDTLLADTRLEYTYVNDTSVAVRPISTVTEEQEPGKSQPASSQVLMAQNQTSAQQTQTSRNSETTSKEDKSVPTLEEIIVIGSNIRGVKSASPIVTFDRQDIERSGFSSTEHFIQSIPQNFGGGVTQEGVSTIQGGTSANEAAAVGVNLRGLGNDSTLVLLNGHRVAPVRRGESVDISMIPLDAIDRVDVLADGASAIYGSDAIGGVVNIIVRENYDGAETRIRYGDSNDGGGEEVQFGQTFGKNWNSGNIMLSYTYRDRGNLDSADREITKDARDPNDLLGDRQEHNVLVTLSQELTDRVELYASGLYSNRDQIDNTTNFTTGTTTLFSSKVDQQSIGGGLRIDVGDTWQFDVGVQFSKSSSDFTGIRNGISIGESIGKPSVNSFDAKADGTVFRAPGGEAKLAVGGQYRVERLTVTSSTVTNEKSDREIFAVFTELFVPIVGEANRKPGIARLEFTAAGRFEDYSDFGSTTNPKFGLLWSPASSLTLRGTWGTSFRAPLLTELSETINPIVPISFPFADPTSSTGSTPSIFFGGGNAALQSEEATVWTAGADFQPESLPGFTASITYFDIDFEDRIESPLPGSDLFNVLVNEAIFAPIITRDPALEDVLALFANPRFLNLAGVPPEEIGALINSQLINTARTAESGVDFDFNYALDVGGGSLAFQLGGTYLTEVETQLIITGPVEDRLNTAFNPVDLKLHGGVSWNKAGLTAAALVNYVDSYEDIRVGREANIDSWTTINLNIRYDWGPRDVALYSDTVLALSVQNLFDEDPPFLAQTAGYNYDAANANAIGRFAALQIIKKW